LHRERRGYFDRDSPSHGRTWHAVQDRQASRN
jgi:hypothetical protein